MISDYKDGLLKIVTTKQKQNEYGQMLDDIDEIISSAFYRKKRCSNSDKEMAKKNGYTVDFVVSFDNRFIAVKPTNKILIGEKLYEIKNSYEDFESGTIDLVLGGDD